MTLVRCQPYRSAMPMVSGFQHAMNHLVDDFFTAGDEPAAWSPRIDLVETDSQFEVSAELPGLDKDDVKISVRNNLLTISGEKKSLQEKKDRGLYLCERGYGNFSRSFQLPAQVDSANVSASFRNGVLTLILPKSEEAKPRQIEIKVA